MKAQTNINTFSTWAFMLALALCPVLYSYVSSFNLRYCDILFLILVFGVWFLNGGKNIFIFPRFFLVFWIYAAIALIMISHNFKITYLIPGGIAFAIFSMSWGTCSKYFSISVFYAVLRIVFILSVIIFFAQLLKLLPNQYQISAILPISDHVAYTDTDYYALMLLRDRSDRPCSFFLEPAYYAQFLLIYLAVNLFYKTRKDVFFSLSSILCIITLVLLKSGLGLSGLAVLLSIRVIVFFKESKKTRRVLFATLPVLFIAISYYFTTDAGLAVLERQDELTTEGSSGFMRVVQGFMIFDALPTSNKVLGVSMDDVENMHLPFITYDENGDAKMFTNGLCTLLLRTGLLGMILCFVVYFFIWKNGTILSKVLLILLFVMSIIEQVYLLPSMLIISVISSSLIKREEQNENCVHLTNSPL